MCKISGKLQKRRYQHKNKNNKTKTIKSTCLPSQLATFLSTAQIMYIELIIITHIYHCLVIFLDVFKFYLNKYYLTLFNHGWLDG